MNVIVIGAQWGDEGKGKLIDILSGQMDITVRYQGGNNAGHTVEVGSKQYIFHLIPSAILHKRKVCVVGNGVVVDPKALVGEMRGLRQKGVLINPHRLKISTNAHVVMPYHRALDALREARRKTKIGTTGRGIGPCYADKVARCGIRMVDLLNKKVLASKLEDNLREKNAIYKKVFNQKDFPFDAIFREYLAYGRQLKPFICDTALYLNEAIRKGKSVLFEGAQGTFLDIDFGTYPFVTSSNSSAGGAMPGTGVGPTKIDKVIGVIKAYTTRVGEGPFPTEFSSGLKEDIRLKGKEFGATTGRPRRCGWFDGILARYAVAINGITELAVTKLDVLDDLKEIAICTAYVYKGKRYDSFPSDLEIVSKANPVYETLPGWQTSTGGIRKFNQLPRNAQRYLRRIEKLVGVDIKYISIGTKRDEIIYR